MNDHRLPPVPMPLPQAVDTSPSDAAAPTTAELEAWLDQAPLADWARDWLRRLRHGFGEAWPRLVVAGLGGELEVPGWMGPASPEAVWLESWLERSELAPAWCGEGFLQSDPVWLGRLLELEQAKVARSFLVTGNVTDYAFDPTRGYRPTTRLLVDSLIRAKDCVLTYRLAEGLAVHSHDPGVVERLPQAIRELLEAPAYRDDVSLLSQVCYLFDVLGRWLSGSGRGGCQGPDARELRNGVGIVLENVHLIIPADRGAMERSYLVDQLLRWSVSPELFRSSHCLVLLADSLDDVSAELRGRGGKIEQLRVPRPDSTAARLKFLMPLLDAGSRMSETRVARLPEGRGWLDGYGPGDTVASLRRLAADTAGLTLMGIEDLLQQASVRPQRGLDRAAVMRLKRERLHQDSEGLLEVVEPRWTLARVGGYEELKARLREVVEALRRPDDPLLRSAAPMGILFVGPPGTGKSITAEALAAESGVSMVKLGDFRGMYVGESERNLSRILSLIEALHPVIVFVDEMDQAMGRRGGASGDSGVERRIFGRLLEFISDPDHRARILWIGASNVPGSIDPALKRAGRFDLTLPFLLPDGPSRAGILQVLVASKTEAIPDLASALGPADLADLVERTEGFSGAELEAIVGEALRRLARDRAAGAAADRITLELLLRVLEAYAPPGVRGEYQQMEQAALAAVSFLDTIPERYRRRSRTGGAGGVGFDGGP